MGFKEPIVMVSSNQRDLINQYLFFKQMHQVVTQSYASSSSHSVAVVRPLKHWWRWRTPTIFYLIPHKTQAQARYAQYQTNQLPCPYPNLFLLSGGSSFDDPTYIKKMSVYPLIQIESKFWGSNPQEIAKKILTPNANFIQKIPIYTQKFSEFILADTRSCLFKLHMDKPTQTYV